MGVQRLPRYPRLHTAIQIARVDLKDVIHLRQINRDASCWCIDMPLKRGARAKCNYGHFVCCADPDDIRHVLGRFRENYGVRGLILDPGRRVTMLFTQRLPSMKPFAKLLLENPQDSGNARLVTGKIGGLSHNVILYSPRAMPSRRGSAPPRRS